MHQQQAGSGPEEVLSTASRAEQATESSSTVEVEVTAVSPAKIAAHQSWRQQQRAAAQVEAAVG